MNEADEKALLEQLKKVDDDHPRTAYGFRLGFKSGVARRDAQPAVAVNESVGVIERYGYQALFNAIAEATKIEGGHIGVSVIAFAKSLEAAIAAAEQQGKGE